MDKPDKEPKKKMGIMALLGAPEDEESEGEDEYGDHGAMSLKAVWRAIKDDDEEGFSEAMREWMDGCMDGKPSKSDD
jgi:hypothetical protein